MPSLTERIQYISLRLFAKNRSRNCSLDRPSPFRNATSIGNKPRIEIIDPCRNLLKTWNKFFNSPDHILEVPYYYPPWNPDPKIHYHLRSLPFQKSDLSPIEITAYFNEYLNTLPDKAIHIASDGSLSKESAGFGYTCPILKINKCFSLPDNTSIFSAEGYAIYEAIKNICISNEDYFLFTDNLSHLSALKNISSSSPTITTYIANLMNGISPIIKSLHLIWTPSHQGIHLNEVADKLANSGKLSKNDYHNKVSLEDFHIKIATNMHKNQFNTWNESKYATEYPHIHPLHHWMRSSSSSRSYEVLITRIRSNTAPLANYLNKIRQIDSPLCEFCLMPETVQHFFNECLLFTTQRQKLQDQLTVPNNSTLYSTAMKKIQESSTAVHFIENFIKSTHRFDFLT